mgnify:CR=1 FL=1
MASLWMLMMLLLLMFLTPNPTSPALPRLVSLQVCWVTIEPKMNLYASHYAYVKLAYKIVVGEELE